MSSHRRWARLGVGILCLCTVPVACAVELARATGPAASQPAAIRAEHPYFPLAAGTTWKYRVTTQVNAKPADKPYVQTLAAGEPIPAPGGVTLFPIDADGYDIRPDGVYLYARRTGAKLAPLDEARKLLSARLRTSDAWTAGNKSGDSSYATCLGNQTVKTEAGEFATQCVFTTVTSADGSQAQVYRYYARNVGLVRETSTEKTKGADGAVTTRQVSRDLIAFTPAAAQAATTAEPPPQPSQPIGADAVRGELVDPLGQPIAQADLTLRRVDLPGVQVVQTDFAGRFAANGLDPAGTYVLESRLIGYAPADLPLHSPDRKPVPAALKLDAAAPATAATASPADGPLAEGKKLAAAGDHKAALAKYDEALAADPRNASAMAYKALSQLALARAKDAQATVESALRLNDKDAQIWEVAGQVKVAQGQIDQARSLFDKAAQLSPKTAGAIYMDLAAALAGKNDAKLSREIESALKAAAAADPPSAEALFQLGQSYANAGRQEGKTYLQRYLDLSAKLPEAERDKQKMQVARQLIRALDVIQGK
jgi:Flp pilus assembly protein TadD